MCLPVRREGFDEHVELGLEVGLLVLEGLNFGVEFGVVDGE